MWKRGAVTKAGSQGSAGFADITKEKIENGVAAPAMEGGQGRALGARTEAGAMEGHWLLACFL